MPAPIRMPGISWCKRRNMPPLTRVLLDWSRASRLSAPLRHALTARGLYCATGDEPSPDVLRRLPESNRKSIANPSSVSRARSEERSSLCLGVSKASRFTRGKPSVPHCVYTGRAKSRTVRSPRRQSGTLYLRKGIRARQHVPAWPNLTEIGLCICKKTC